MANPWNILGLDADTANEKQVRSAYAKLLKVYRPDQDPEGFQRLRTAYDYALQWLKQRSSVEEDNEWGDDVVNVLPEEPWEKSPPVVSTPPPLPPPLPGGPPPLPPLPSSWPEGEVPVLPHKLGETPAVEQRRAPKPERNWPREWSYSLESLDRALKKKPRQLDVIAMALRALAGDVMECGIPPVALECILSDAFDTDMRLFGMSAHTAILFCLLRGGCTGFVQSAMDALVKADSQSHLPVFVQKLDDCLADALSPSTVDVFFHAAGLIALDKPFVAHSILRKLQRLLDASEYSTQLEGLQTAITRGLALRELEPVHRAFWAQRLEHPESACDWEAQPSVDALFVTVLHGSRWAGYPLVQSVVPAEVWRKAWKERWFQVVVFRLRNVLNARNLMVAGFAFLGGGMLILGGHRYTEITTPTYKPDPATQTEEYQRKYQQELELVKKYKEEKRRRTGTQ